MRAVKYGVRLDDCRHPSLVEEGSAKTQWKYANSPERIAELLNGGFGLDHMAEEYVYLVAMSQACEVLGVFEVSHGTANMSPCQAREAYMRALLCGAVTIVLAHNHPSGDVTPSKADAEAYRNMKKAGEIMKVPLTDFLIVGSGRLYSFEREYEG